MRSLPNSTTAGLALMAIVLGGHLVWRPIRQGWSQMYTDFPNHYVAAVATIHHQSLRRFYDWEWFQRQIHYAGIEHRLGGYSPYTPLTMLPYLPVARLQPQQAKQVWIVAEVGFLAAAVWLLAWLTGLGFLTTLVLALLAHSALSSNFLLGHYYIFLMLLLACAAACLLKGRDVAGGALLGLIFALKLYAAPFALYFLVRRQWRAFWGMIGAIVCLTFVAVAMFGWSDVWFFATNIMPRAIDGAVVDPYNPGLGSLTVLLRRAFVPEAELNPHPFLNAPLVFFFLQSLYTIGILTLSLLVLPKEKDDAKAFAWFTIVLFALSPITATYHFVLLLVPIVILLRREAVVWSAGLIALYVLVELPLRPWNSWLFPKVWLLLALLLYTGWRFVRRIPARSLVVAGGITVAIAASAALRWRAYQLEPQMIYQHAVHEPGALFSSAPALSPNQTVFESMPVFESGADDRFVLRASRPTGLETFKFEGHAFHPTVPASGEPIYFELLTGGHSHISSYREATGKLDSAAGADLDAIEPAVSSDGAKLAFVSQGSLVLLESGIRSVLIGGERDSEVSDPSFFPNGQLIVFAQGVAGSRAIRSISESGGEPQTLTREGDCFEPAVAPDGTRIAFACSGGGGTQVWMMDLKTRIPRQITHGACNNTFPAWDPDSASIVFASDCNRGVELPTLYRAKIQH